MTSNFTFVNDRLPKLYKSARQAEKMVYTAPRGSCFYARFTLEIGIVWLYDRDPYLNLPTDRTLGSLIREQTFKDNLKPGLYNKIRLIQRIGNLAAHDANIITSNDALCAIGELFHFLYWLCRFYTPEGRELEKLSLKFDRSLVPNPKQRQDLTIQQIKTLETQLSQADEMRCIAEEREKQTNAELEAVKAQIEAIKQENAAVADTYDYNEADTRTKIIDVMLKEVGWYLDKPECREYPVKGMPKSTNPSGRGYVDYVLWGDDGKPLAIIEAKRTLVNPNLGKTQAKLYADCLQKKFSQRPIIFYSNGYQHYLWDDCNYPPREVRGFFKKDELERIIFRRKNSKKLHLVTIKQDIVNRSYQQEAIRSITEAFDKHKIRKALLVMATGTGKTRTAIALIDLLMRAKRVKKVLFLADRLPLLTQAWRAFKDHLPTASAIDLTKNSEVETVSVVLSTYPTMLNRINSYKHGKRLFGCGHFDLIIVDEAHRSIYQKYREIFEYFDAHLVGLTATPRSEINRDTYRVFELDPGVPTFAYELDDAIKDGHLVPPRGVNVPFKFMRRGIRFADLSPEEREEYEDRFRDEETGEIPDEVNAAALNQWLFNIDTVDKALKILMDRGLKIEGGDRLGKTIIFARNHNHAEFIVKRFDLNYPHYKGDFARVIDSHDRYAQSILDNFLKPEKEPTIAVSVDMLDTGVDVPQVLNLVFFKPVYSRVKFNQMIGRGTRLCLDLFGIGEHKTEFLIFDLCSNFDFFAQEVPPADPKLRDSLTARLVKTRLALIGAIPNNQEIEIKNTLIDELHRHVASMERANFLVRPYLEKVEEFSKRDRWESLNKEDLQTISQALAPLPNGLPKENRIVKEFDLLCFKLQLAILEKSKKFITLRDRIRDILHGLEEKRDIPMVKEKLALIAEVQEENWWSDVTISMVEKIRIKLRELIQFIDRTEQKIVYTDFIDELGEISDTDVPIQQTGFSPYQYKKKVETYIKNNENHLVIAKSKRNQPLTEADLNSLEAMLFNSQEIESREQFEIVYGKNISLKLFIRKIVGLDRAAAKQAFAKYLEGNNYTANQIRFIETIIDLLTQKGVIDPGILYETPFTDLHYEGLDGVFNSNDADNIVDIIRAFNHTVGETFGAA